MSRIGKFPIPLPKGVEVKVSDKEIVVKGPKGTLTQTLLDGLAVKVEPTELHVVLTRDDQELSPLWGLYRALIANMVQGTTVGFDKKLEMVGIGYRAAVQGNLLDLQIGFSHPTKIPIPEGIKVVVDKGNLITVSGINKQAVGQFAAAVRAIRPPEPYQGKGIRYEGEYVRKKAGKAAATAKSS